MPLRTFSRVIKPAQLAQLEQLLVAAKPELLA